jgi:hypothetical protein
MSFTLVEVELATVVTTATISQTMTNAVAAGDLLVAIPYYFTSTANHLSSLSCADTVNTGSYAFPSQAQIFATGAGNPQTAVSWIKCNAAGTPTVTMSGNSGGDQWQMAVIHYTCSNKSPGFVVADTTAVFGSSTNPTATGFTNSFANELTLALAINGVSAYSSLTGGFTVRLNGGEFLGDLLTATSGNSISWSASVSPTTPWGSVLASFNDLPSNVATIAWIT